MRQNGSIPLPGTAPLEMEGDLAAAMVAGIRRFLERETAAAKDRRSRRWKRDFSSPARYEESVEDNRRHLRRMIGAVDEREPAGLQVLSPVPGKGAVDPRVGQGPGYSVSAVRWPALKGVEGEGLLLQPEGRVRAEVVALPDCDWTPEMLVGLAPGVPARAQFARRLAENNCRVLVPFLLDRGDTYSGIPGVGMTNQPHREFVYRAAFELGRHVIGYEVHKVLAAVDGLVQLGGSRPLGVIGYGEGGLLALYAAALDPRIGAVAVSGYFGPRERLWEEPIYRNVFGLLEEFGDAELASLVGPRPVCVEICEHPQVDGPPRPSPGRAGAAPGVLRTPPREEIEAEFARARELVAGLDPALSLVESPDGLPGSEPLLRQFLGGLGLGRRLRPARSRPRSRQRTFDLEQRRQRQFAQLVDHTQHLLAGAEFARKRFWAKADDADPAAWQQSCRWYRRYLAEEVIGQLPGPRRGLDPRTRKVYDEPFYQGYEVVLDVYPEVFAYGILLVPRKIKKGERRPVVVCQHGLEGRPQDVADPRVQNPSYNQYACRLAEQGYVVYAPQNPYLGGDAFRVLQRLANPLGKSLFSVIVRQHERTLDWLADLPFVDSQRIAFYGLSYGGKSAMRVPALEERYCLSICSADYNEWIWKNTSARHGYSYLITGEYEMFEFDLGNTFNYAEMSWLIFPRPFMVERGHHDGVAPDEWVAYEFARTRRHYVLQGLGERTQVEFFDGPHTINGQGTFRFLEKHLGPRGRRR